MLNVSINKSNSLYLLIIFLNYGYFYMLNKKNQEVNALKIFINEAERQLDRNVKFVRSNIMMSIMEDMTSLRNILVHFLSFLNSVVFLCNTQFRV